MNSGLWVASSPSFRKAGPISKTRSIPPSTRRFSQISGAIRRASCLFENSVATVVKGLAIAPPALSAMIGVWTSRKLSLSRKSRIYCMICERTRILCATDRLTSISTWRFRIRVSGCSSLYGSCGKEGDRIFGSSAAFIDISAECVAYGVPITAGSYQYYGMKCWASKTHK